MKTTNWMLPLLFAGATFAAAPALAQTYAWSGSDLATDATFPAQQPQVIGSSLFFGPAGISTIHQVLDLTVPALPAGTERITLRVNLTRPLCTSGGCNGGDDFDPMFGLTTGNSLLAGALADLGGGAVIASQQWSGSGIFYGIVTNGPLATVPLPAVDQAFEMTVTYDLSASGTTVTTTYSNATSTITSPVVLDPAQLHFVYLRDNDSGEQFQINSVVIETEGGEQAVAVDIKPGSCPNPLSTKDRGVVPVAISGSATLDVNDINPDSVRLAGVAPLRWSQDDVASPYAPYTGKVLSRLSCTTARGDGTTDLVLKFDAQALTAALGGSVLVDGQVLRAPLTGELLNGTAIVGEDIMWVRGNK